MSRVASAGVVEGKGVKIVCRALMPNKSHFEDL